MSDTMSTTHSQINGIWFTTNADGLNISSIAFNTAECDGVRFHTESPTEGNIKSFTFTTSDDGSYLESITYTTTSGTTYLVT